MYVEESLFDNAKVFWQIPEGLQVHPLVTWCCSLIRKGLSRIGSLNDTTVASYARIILACNLQLLSTILDPKNRSCWVFSLANHASTHFGKSYFDNRIRIHINGKLYNFHALAVPMFEQHTSENMFNLVCRFLNVLCPRWRTQLIGIGSESRQCKLDDRTSARCCYVICQCILKRKVLLSLVWSTPAGFSFEGCIHGVMGQWGGGDHEEVYSTSTTATWIDR